MNLLEKLMKAFHAIFLVSQYSDNLYRFKSIITKTRVHNLIIDAFIYTMESTSPLANLHVYLYPFIHGYMGSRECSAKRQSALVLLGLWAVGDSVAYSTHGRR